MSMFALGFLVALFIGVVVIVLIDSHGSVR